MIQHKTQNIEMSPDDGEDAANASCETCMFEVYTSIEEEEFEERSYKLVGATQLVLAFQ